MLLYLILDIRMELPQDIQGISIVVIEIWSLLALKKVWIFETRAEYRNFVRNMLHESDQQKIGDNNKFLTENV